MTSLTQINQASGPLTQLRRATSQWLSYSVPPEPRPSRQSSSPQLILCVWQSTTKSSSPLWLNIADSAVTWFTSYLTNRTFQVTWNGSLSKPFFLETGVPQGSVSGPDLFLLYLDHSALQSHHIDSLTTVMPTTPNCSSLSPHPPPAPTLWLTLNVCRYLCLDSCSSPQTQP